MTIVVHDYTYYTHVLNLLLFQQLDSRIKFANQLLRLQVFGVDVLSNPMTLILLNTTGPRWFMMVPIMHKSLNHGFKECLLEYECAW
jgi:hypothetical protein